MSKRHACPCVRKRDSHSFNQNFTMFFTCRIRPMCPKATWYHNLRVMGAWGPLYKDPLANCGLALDISRDLHSYLANCATTLGIVNKALSKHMCLCLNHKNCGPALSMGPCINIGEHLLLCNKSSCEGINLKIWVCLVISCFELSFVFGVEMASPAEKLKCVKLKLMIVNGV